MVDTIPRFHCVMIFVLLFTSVSALLSQDTSYPPLEDVEREHGYLQLTEEEIVALEEADLRQLIVEQDVDGFIEEFSEEYESGTDDDPLEIIREFMEYFFQVMNQRQVMVMPDSVPIQSKGISSTWDLMVKNLNIQKAGKNIKIEFTIAFMGLVDQLDPANPLSENVKLKFHKKRNRWKIKTSEGLFPFFIRCIQRIQPQSTLPAKFAVLKKNRSAQGRVKNETY